MGSESSYYKEIINKLERLVKREYAFSASLGIQFFLLTAVLAFFTFVFVEMVSHFSAEVRTILITVLSVLLVSLFAFLFLLPVLKYFKLFRRTDYFGTAGKVGSNFPLIKDDLLNAMQLVSSGKESGNYSTSLVEAAFNNVFVRARDLKFESIVKFNKAKKLFLYLSGVTVFCAVLVVFVPGMRAASFRIINYNKEFITPPKFSFDVEPGNSRVTKGDNLTIRVKVNGSIPKAVYLEIKNAEQTGFEKQQLYGDSSSNFHYEVPAVRNSFKYYAAAENIKSEVYSVEVIDRPIVRNLNLKIISPAYSKIAEVEQKDNGNVTALLGSRVYLQITSTKDLKSAKLQFGDTTNNELKINARQAAGSFVVKKDNDYRIILNDLDGNRNLSPITYTIKVLYDAYPSIEMIAPNQDVNLPASNRLPLSVKISDDYGFTKLLLHYRLSSSKYEAVQKDYKAVEIPINKSQTSEEVSYIWNLSDLGLTEQDIVTYYLEVFDNDNVSGPKSAKSSTFSVRIPSLNELLNNANDVQNQSQKDLNDTFKEAQELKQRLDEINQELKKDKKDISWQEKQKIEQAVDQFKKLQDKVSDISKKIEKMQQNLQQNNLLSKETMEKYNELQKLFDEMSNEEMRKAMEQMQNVLQSLNRQLTQQQMENFKLNEDQFRQSIERTMNLLKRIQVEQKIDELLKRTDQITQQQNELKNQAAKSSKSDSNEQKQMGEKQSDITKDLENYDRQLDDLSKKMDELKDMPKGKLDEMRKEFEKQQNEQLSKQASQNLQQGQIPQAQQSQSQIAQNMNQMKSQMQALKQSIQQQSQLQAFTDMMRITDNLITLSKQQENLKKQTEKLDPSSSEFNRNAKQQSDIKRNLDKIMQQMSALSQKTFAITPEMGKALGDARQDMNNSINGLQNRNGNQAAMTQGNAMESLNQAADLVKSSMEKMMKGGGQGGMMSLMQQLQQMSGQQMSLNNLTQMLQQAMSGNLTMQQQAELQRLAQQQDVIRKSLQQLNKEAMQSGESKKIPADLNDIAKKMEEVVKNLSSHQLDDQTVQKQEHILSRLLDAQKSVNERDYQNERESKSGQDIVRESPAQLNLSSDKGKNKIKDELNKSVREGYTKDYENLIKKYYEALQKESSK